MKITVFGATGLMGNELVKQALLAGHHVVAYGRNVHELISLEELKMGQLTLHKGGMFDQDLVEKAIENADAVVSALGGGTDGLDKTRSLGMKHIIAAMKKHKVGRIIGIGGMGILDSTEADKMLFETENFPPQFVPVSQEHLEAFLQLKASDLQYSFVCPPMIKDAEATGVYKTEINTMPTGNFSITKGDLAMYMLKIIPDQSLIGCKVGISN
jgi:uncharacterized protein